MKAARLHAAADLRVDEEPAPVAAEGMSLVKVTAIGICGSDLHWWGEGGIGDAGLARPLVLGHEAAGVIADGPRAGERVAIDPAIPDETCEMCRRGYRNLCTGIAFAGHGSQDGAMREFLAWPSHLLHPLPDTVSDAGGAILEPLGVAIHATDLGHLHLGGSALVAGCGPIGLLLIQLLRGVGAASVIALDPLAHRRAAAARCTRSWEMGRMWHLSSPAPMTECSSRWRRPGRAGGSCSAASPATTGPASAPRLAGARA
jgi:L-iditol 2-dehydrogenase